MAMRYAANAMSSSEVPEVARREDGISHMAEKGEQKIPREGGEKRGTHAMIIYDVDGKVLGFQHLRRHCCLSAGVKDRRCARVKVGELNQSLDELVGGPHERN